MVNLKTFLCKVKVQNEQMTRKIELHALNIEFVIARLKGLPSVTEILEVKELSNHECETQEKTHQNHR